MVKNNFLIFILIFFLGILFGILFSKYIIPRLETLLLVSEREIETLPEIKVPQKETEILCLKVKDGIEVDLTNQKTRLCENGKAIEEFSVSTGKKETPTPTGEFFVKWKDPMIYSKIAKSWLPFWVGFKGDYGFHELPIDEEGKRIGEEEIGKPASLGCVRLKVGDAQKLYQFAKIHTKVLIFGETPQ